jgi:hypothetical protein
MKDRSTVTEDEKMHWLVALSRLFCIVYDHERIMKVKESCWPVHLNAVRTWAPPV